MGIWGLTYIVLGLVAENLPVSSEDKGLVKANGDFASTFGLDFLGWGLIILAIAAVAAVVVLLLYSNKVDTDYEKTVRRARRLAQLEEEEAKEDALEQQEEAIDAEVEPAPEAPEENQEQPEEKVEEPAPEEAEDAPAEEEEKPEE